MTPVPTGTADIPAVVDRNVFRPGQGPPLVISFKAPSDGLVTVKVYSLAGELVDPVFQAPVQQGLWFQATWDGRNMRGESVAAGLYFVSIKGAGIKSIRKVIVLK